MHTRDSVKVGDFEFYIDGKLGSLEDIFSGFNKTDRIGIVTHSEGGTLGVSALLMAAVTAFYDMFDYDDVGNERDKLRIYPEYFIFHVGHKTGSNGQLDIWPPHREIIVENDSEQILEAINDRGITRLLIEEKSPSPTLLLRESKSSAESRIKSLFMFSPTGSVEKGDITVVNNGSILKIMKKAHDESVDEIGEVRGRQIAYSQKELSELSKVTQVYKRIDLHTALKSLSENEEASATTLEYVRESAPGADVRL